MLGRGGHEVGLPCRDALGDGAVGRTELVQVDLPIFSSREGIAVGEPSRGCIMGAALLEQAKALALRAWNDKREAKVAL